EVVIRIYDIDEQTVSINVDSVSLMEPCDPVETPTPTPTQTITPTPTTAPCDINIIPNAGFEMWTGMILDIWTPESGIQAVQNTVNVVEGLTSVDLSRTLLGTDLTSAYVPVIGGEVYDAGIQVIDNHPDINARFYVLFYNSAFTYMNSSQWQDTAGQSPDWQVLGTGSILIPASAAWARIRVRFFDDDGTWPGSATGTITIDDSWLIRPCNEPTPTPTVTPTAAATVSIYDIQYSTTGSSPLNGTMVRTQGIVTAAETGNDNVFIQENYAAPWSGLHIHMPTGIGSIQRGDLIIVQGVVAEISGMTSIDNPDSVTIISSGNTLPPPAILAPETLASAITAEAYEGVLAQLQTVMVIDVNSGPGEWDVTNGTGIATVDDMYTYLYAPTLYEMIDWVQGPVSSEAGAYKLQPRDDNDISATFVPLPAVGGWGIGALAAGMGLVLVRRRRQR
ncbi:hypothetical protein JXA80_10505, partial [bacterium]|nr:hypothetical protein [candidate division CSSED10-310 bacterium]